MDNFLNTIDGFLDNPPEGVSAYRWQQLTLPFLLTGILVGGLLMLTILIVLEIRKCIYNRNRNLVYAEKKAKWRRKSKGCWKIPLPPPPGFAEALCRQWDRARDSLDEMLKFGDMLVELDDYVDNSFIFNARGDVISRGPGIKGFLKDYCGHIPYKTAMRYRILALKAQAIAKAGGDIPRIRKGCKTIRSLAARLDSHFDIERRRLKYKRRRKHLCHLKPKFAVADLRERVYSDISRVHASQSQLYISALQEIANKFSSPYIAI